MSSEALTEAELGILGMYCPNTYCVDLPHTPERERLVKAGLIEWVPAPAWSGHHTYGLTPAGRALLHKGESDGP